MKKIKGLEVEPKSYKSNTGRLDERGRELLDGRPMEPPVGYNPQPSLMEKIRKMVHDAQVQRDLAKAGVETFDEANDFDVGDDYDPTSPWEQYYEPTPFERFIADKEAAQKAEPPREPPSGGAAQPPAEGTPEPVKGV
ncbi:hypothetical protein [Microviridae sp.]|nr:hypothetical protein [Microviridae sp.]